MAVARASVPASAYDLIGRAGVRTALDHLFAVRCQTCRQPLGSPKPVLVFQQWRKSWPSQVDVSLHHRSCRDPVWDDSDLVTITDAPSSRYKDMAAPPGSRNPIPFLIVNPAMESIVLHDQDGRWVVQEPLPGKGFFRYRSGEAASAKDVLIVLGDRLPDGRTVGRVMIDGREEWTMALEDLTARQVRDLGGIVLVLTHDLDPQQLDASAYRTQEQLSARLVAGDCTYAAVVYRGRVVRNTKALT